MVDLRYQAKTGDKDRKVTAKIERYGGALFPRIEFIVPNRRWQVHVASAFALALHYQAVFR